MKLDLPYLWSFCLSCLVLVCACQPSTGDSCQSSLTCSPLGDRYCDVTQPGGYCTVAGCEAGSCPDDSVCVRFRPSELRLSSLYCMAECDDDGDCREDEGYRCLSEAGFGREGEMEADVLDGNKKFCAQRAEQFADGGTAGSQ